MAQDNCGAIFSNYPSPMSNSTCLNDNEAYDHSNLANKDFKIRVIIHRVLSNTAYGYPDIMGLDGYLQSAFSDLNSSTEPFEICFANLDCTTCSIGEDLEPYIIPEYLNLFVVNDDSKFGVLPGLNLVQGFANLNYPIPYAVAHAHPNVVQEVDAIAAHEIGHILGLLHTNERNMHGKELVTRDNSNSDPNCHCNCNTSGDLICDTPANNAGSTICDSSSPGLDDCGSSYLDQGISYNFMGSLTNYCRDKFYHGQFQRMKYMLENHPTLKTFYEPRTTPVFETNTTINSPSNLSSSTYYYNEDLIVNDVLELDNSTLLFTNGKGIIITNNGKLNMSNGVTLTSTDCNYECTDQSDQVTKWSGIKVEGQIKNTNGICNIENAERGLDFSDNDGLEYYNDLDNFIIKNCDIGIYVGSGNFEAQFNVQSIENSQFLLNFQDINIQSGYTLNIKDCFFESGSYFKDMFVEISGSTYNNSNNNASGNTYIESLNSNIVLKESTTPYTTSFLGNTHSLNISGGDLNIDDVEFISNTGVAIIYNSEMTTPGSFSLKNSEFKACFAGVEISGPSNTVIKNNLFEIDSDVFNSSAIKIYTAEGLIVSSNTMQAVNGSTKVIGISDIAYNENTISNKIVGNHIIDCQEGINLQNDNGGNMLGIGIELLCNKFENTSFKDIFTNDINREQGASNNPTGTIYSNTGTASIGNQSLRDFDKGSFSPSLMTNVYYYSNDINQILDEFNHIEVFGVPNRRNCSSGYTDVPTSYDADPDPDSVWEVIFDPVRTELDDTWMILNDSLYNNSIYAVLQDLINANDGEGVIDLVQSISPYLSVECIMLIFDNSTLFSEEEMTNILVLNPDLVRLKEVYSVVMDEENFSEEHRLDILNQLNYPTSRTLIENQISDLTKNLDNTITLALHDFHLRADKDLAIKRKWLARYEQYSTELDIAESYMQEQNYVGALTHLSNISDLSNEEMQDLSEYTSLKNVLISVYNSNRDESQLTNSEKAQIRNIANGPFSYSSRNARSILSYFYGETFSNRSIGKRVKENKKLIYRLDSTYSNFTVKDQVILYPNPTTGILHIENLPVDKEYVLLNVYSIDGRLIFEKKFTNTDGVKSLNLDLSNGVHNYKIRTKAKDLKYGKIIIVK